MNRSDNGCGLTTDTSHRKSSDSVGSMTRKTSRRCMFGCTDGSSTLCRFPVHDPKRCQDWIDFFQVSEKHIRESSLVNLRVCMKHFKEKVTMINGKLTRHPSVDSVSSTQSSKGTKRSRRSSFASSTHSDYTSDSEPRSKRSSGSIKSREKLSIGDINGGNRKLFVITQSDENKTDSGAPGQKSKMFLILENGDDNDESKKHQKITLIADKSDAQTAERIEQLLPQLIQRIQSENEQRCQKVSIDLVNAQDQQSGATETGNDLPLQIQRVETLSNIHTPPKQKTTEVNLSSDLLFLMKMLPKLEAIEEPIKEHIKRRIENILTDPVGAIAQEACYPKAAKNTFYK